MHGEVVTSTTFGSHEGVDALRGRRRAALLPERAQTPRTKTSWRRSGPSRLMRGAAIKEVRRASRDFNTQSDPGSRTMKCAATQRILDAWTNSDGRLVRFTPRCCSDRTQVGAAATPRNRAVELTRWKWKGNRDRPAPQKSGHRTRDGKSRYLSSETFELNKRDVALSGEQNAGLARAYGHPIPIRGLH